MSESYQFLYTDASIPDCIAALNGIKPVEDFETLMRRKIYTYNAASAIIAYIGAQKGYEIYADAANDEEIDELLEQFYGEINKAICREYGIDKKEQREFALLSKKKFQNPKITDTVSRNAASPLRKLMPSERLIEPMRLISRHGGNAGVLAKTVLAAIHYSGVYDQAGITGILSGTCGLDENEALFKLIIEMREK
jgi:mannitol-1-phosphate 5-dehydrogenase